MKKLRMLLSMFLLILFCNNMAIAQPLRDNNVSIKSVAIVLKINGGSERINNIQILSFHLFNGKVKNTNETKPVKTSDILKINVFDDSNKLIYEGYHENPLNQTLESFEEDGTINNNILPDTTGYINIRFPFSGNIQNILMNCYSLKNNYKEDLVSSLKYKVQ